VTTIELRGIVARGSLGATVGERATPQEVSIDLDVDVDPSEDELAGTVDYRVIASRARAVVEEGSYTLLETLAGTIAEAVRELEGVRGVRATVHKPGAAAGMGVLDVAARAQR
jgi:dihydroneopterin aldolase